MTTVNDIYTYIDTFAPFCTAEGYDNVGILAGDPDREVKRAMLALDITRDVVSEAASLGAQVIISHHPVIFQPIKRVLKNTAVYGLIKNDISAICAHTNLDKSTAFGVNTELALAAGLENIKVSDDSEFLFLGYSNSLSAAAFADILKTGTDCKTLQYTCTNNRINKVGLCSGAGGSEIYAAVKNGCDAFVTGEMKHHEIIFANENNVSVFILGHYKSEDVVISPLAEKLSTEFPEIEFIKSRIFSDGIIC